MEQHIDVCSYHIQAPPESSYSTKSTANLSAARQRIIDSVIRQRDFVPTDFRPPSNTSSSNDKRRPGTATKYDRSRQCIPNLYANQRVRERSSSKDPPIKLQRDLKKTVAFGRTTTIRESRSLNSIRPTTSTINHSNNSINSTTKLQNEVQYLRSYVDSNDKLRKDVDQIQKVLKTLIEENVELQTHVHESQKSQMTIKQLQKEVQELSENNSALRTRVNLLEVWYARAKAEENSKVQKQPRIDKFGQTSTVYHQNPYSNGKKLENDAFNKKKLQNGYGKPYKNEYDSCRRLAQIYIGDEDRSSHKYSEPDEDSSRFDDRSS